MICKGSEISNKMNNIFMIFHNSWATIAIEEKNALTMKSIWSEPSVIVLHDSIEKIMTNNVLDELHSW